MPISIVHQFQHETLYPGDHRLSLTEAPMDAILATCRAAYQPACGRDMRAMPRHVPGTGRCQRHEDTPLSLAGIQ